MSNQNFAPSLVESHMDSPGDSLDLREHMVGILFSRSKLTHLQKQVSEVIKDSEKLFTFDVLRSLFISSILFGKKRKSLVKNGNCTSAPSVPATSLKAR